MNSGPDRPSTFRETQEERTELAPDVDYSIDETGDPTEQDFGWPTDELEPIPVFLTESIPVHRRLARGELTNYPINGQRAVRVASEDKRRIRVVVRNNSDSANPVFLLTNQTQPSWTGYRLAAGEDLELTHTRAVFATCAENGNATVSILAEYEVDDLDDQ